MLLGGSCGLWKPSPSWGAGKGRASLDPWTCSLPTDPPLRSPKVELLEGTADGTQLSVTGRATLGGLVLGALTWLELVPATAWRQTKSQLVSEVKN